MNTTKRAVRGAAALLTLGLLSAGCGGEGGYEEVFLYFINGYPGTGSMTVLTETGPLVNGALFGDRMGADGVCAGNTACLPYTLDRAFGSEFTVLMEGMPRPAQVNKNLFALYPHETATMIVTSRTSNSGVNAMLFRHVQTIDPACGIMFANGLSLSNAFMWEDAGFSISPEFELSSAEAGGFIDETTQPFITECGPLPLNTPDHDNIARSALYDEVTANPWFYPVSCEDSLVNNTFCWGWGSPNAATGRSELFSGGQILAPLTSREFYQCVQGAIEIKEEMDPMNPDPFGIGQVECPATAITWDDVQVDFQALASCYEPVTRSVETIEPDGDESSSTWSIFFNDPDDCDAHFRMRTAGLEIVFGPEGSAAKGEHLEGAPVETNTSIDIGSVHYWVLLGRPVNPIVWQWDSGENFVNLADFPYLNGQDSRIGDYDD